MVSGRPDGRDRDRCSSTASRPCAAALCCPVLSMFAAPLPLAVRARSLPDVRLLSSMSPTLSVEVAGVRRATQPAKGGGKNPEVGQHTDKHSLQHTNSTQTVRTDRCR